MKKCENCNIEIIGKAPTCPICGALVGGEENSPFSYPEYRVKHKVVKRVFIMLTIAALVIGLFVNAFTYRKASYPWVAVMAGGVFIGWLVIGSWLSRKMSWGAKIFNTFAGALLTCILVDISSGWHGWSCNLAFPIAVNSDIVTMTILVLCGKRNYRRFFSYFIISLTMSVLPPVLYLLGLAETLWLSLSPLLNGFLALLVVFTVSPSRWKEESRKRFHL